MELKRYTQPELEELLTKIFLDYMVNSGVEEAHKDYIENKKVYEQSLKLLKTELSAEPSKEDIGYIEEGIKYVQKGLEILENSNLENQKRLYRNTGATDFSRSYVQIPLNKRLNSLYDDLILEVLFYDNISTLNGEYETFKALESTKEMEEFIKKNIQITHMGLVYQVDGRRIALIEVIGDLNYEDERVKNSNTNLLGNKFVDLKNLTLSDTSEIINNDVKQWIQTKIDLDRENMEELCRVFIRGDYYSIHRPANSKDLFIRFVCRSTGRVYYEKLNLENLTMSDYFKVGNYESYAKAWWNLTHLGSKVEGKPIVRC